MPPTEPPPFAPTDTLEPPEVSSRFDLVIVLLLGLAATLAAFASYQSSLLGGDSLKEFSKAAVSSDQAGQYWNDGYSEYTTDQVQWVGYSQAKSTGNTKLVAYYREHLMENYMADAVEWFEDPANEADTPFDEVKDNPYRIKAWEKAKKLDDLADEQQTKGERLDKWGDSYDLNAVLLALALFMLGLAAVLHQRRSKLILTGIGVLICIGSSIHMLSLGFYFE